MIDGNQDGHFRKSKRNFSDLANNLYLKKSRQEDLYDQRFVQPKANSIKINHRNKLPPDFFPRSESLRKKINSNRPSVQGERNYAQETSRKATTERRHISPEKTSFFGFFEEHPKTTKNHANTINLKRKFESRQEPKRQKILIQQRNFTPMTKAQRGELLQLFPASHDPTLIEAIISSTKSKNLHISLRKEHMSKHQEAQQALNNDPEKQEGNFLIKGQTYTEDIQNITFFNAKSTSFPPINKNKSST